MVTNLVILSQLALFKIIFIMFSCIFSMVFCITLIMLIILDSTIIAHRAVEAYLYASIIFRLNARTFFNTWVIFATFDKIDDL